jgi:hypothetical protein
MERCRPESRTAEHLGADGLEWDRVARRSRLDDAAGSGSPLIAGDPHRLMDLYSEELRREGNVVLALGPDGASPVRTSHKEVILVARAETVEA